MRKSNPLDEINEMVKKMEIDDAEFAVEDAALEQEWQDLHSDEDDELDEDYEDDGQPSEYDEWQDFYGGDDGDQGQYDLEDYHDSGIDF
jgi:hypothetical protein